MRKSLLHTVGLIILLVFTSTEAFTQTLPFTARKHFITIGYGFPYTYSDNFKAAETLVNAQGGSFSKSSMGPISLNYEYAIGSRVGLGLDIAYTHAEYAASMPSGTTSYTAQRLGTAMRLAWHPYKWRSWDPYLAGVLGYNVEIGDEYSNPELVQRMEIPAPDDFIYGLKIGVRYFSPASAIGFFTEAGYTNTHFVQLGVAFRFGPDRETTINVWERRRR